MTREIERLQEVLAEAAQRGKTHIAVRWGEFADNPRLAASRIRNASRHLDDGIKVHVYGTADGLETLSVGIAVDKPLAARKLRRRRDSGGGTSPVVCPKRSCLFDIEPIAHYRPVRHGKELTLHKVVRIECARHGVLATVHTESELAMWLIDNTRQVDLWRGE